MNNDSGQNPISGTDSADNLTGTSGADHLQGMAGDDVLNGGAGADTYDGGAGSDRYVLSDTDAVDTLNFQSDDVLDISNMLPDSGVTEANLKQFVKITANGVYVDGAGGGQFSADNQVARFAAGNPPLNAMVAVQVADTSVIHFDWAETADIPLMEVPLTLSESSSESLNTVQGTSGNDTLQGTASGDALYGQWGDDVISGGEGSDLYVGGQGSDRYVLDDSESVDTLDFQSTRFQQDVLDVSQLLPEGVTADNLASFLSVTDEAVFIDESGTGDFSEANQVAQFTESSTFSRNEILVNIGNNIQVVFNVFAQAGVRLDEGESFQSEEVLASRTERYNPRNSDYESDSGPDENTNTAFLRSQEDELFNFRLDQHQVEEAHGSAGREILDASSVDETGRAQDDDVADHRLWMYGRDGSDTLKGNDEGVMLDGGQGDDRIEAGLGRNMVIGGAGQDEYVLQLETTTADELMSDLLYDFTSIEGHRDLIDLQHVLPAEATENNIHSYVKVTDAGIFIDVNGQATFNESNQLARFGERADIDNLITFRLADGSNVELNRNEALSEFSGTEGDDVFLGGEGGEILRGLDGDDTLDGDALGATKSADHLYGGAGNDKLVIDQLDLTQGTVDGGVGFDTAKLKGDVGESLSLDMQAKGIERAFGGDSDDVLDGSGYTETSGYNKTTGAYESDVAQKLDLFGKGGNDTLKGGIGNDYLDGGTGNDSLSDGAGRDFMAGGSGNDTFILSDDGDLDTLWDFKSTSSEQDVLDISALAGVDFDYNQLASYLHLDSSYVYFDKTGQGNFTYSEAIAKMGGRAELAEPVNVKVNNLQVTFDPDSKAIVFVKNLDEAPDSAQLLGMEDEDIAFGSQFDDSLAGDNGQAVPVELSSDFLASFDQQDVIVNVASGVTLSAGTDNGDGTWTLKKADFSGLTMEGSGNNWVDSLTFTVVNQTQHAVTIGDASFESQALNDGEFSHSPVGSSWSFSGSNNSLEQKIRLDVAPEHGTMQYQNDQGVWTDMQVGVEYPADTEVQFFPDSSDITGLTTDIEVGTFDGFASTSDWGVVNGKEAVFTEGDITITTRSTSGNLTAWNGANTHVGVGIGDNDNNGLSEGESLIITVEGEDVNQIEFTMDGLGEKFDETSNFATEVRITAYDADNNVIGSQGGYRQSGQLIDTYSFTTNTPVHHFEVTTHGSKGNYVVQNMTVSRTLLDFIQTTTIQAGGSEVVNTSTLNLTESTANQTVTLTNELVEVDFDTNTQVGQGIYDDNSETMVAQATDGTDAGFINDAGGTISQTLSENFARNTAYELQVDIGNRNDVSGMGDYQVRLLAGGVVLASDGSVTPAEGQFETLTLSLDGSTIAADSAAIGQPITIELLNNNGQQVIFDNVRMTATVTEEVAQETVDTDQSHLIIGGAGDDVMTGGNDSDTFFWSLEDVGVAGDPAVDTITDFQAGQNGDVINLADVLESDSEPLESYLGLNFDNGETTIEVKPDGDDSVTQKIKLAGVDLSGYGGATTDAEILNNLINDGNLQID